MRTRARPRRSATANAARGARLSLPRTTVCAGRSPARGPRGAPGAQHATVAGECPIIQRVSPPAGRTWQFRPARAAERSALAQELGVDELVAQCLLNRGIEDAASARTFLHGTLAELHPPDSLPDLAPAVARLRKAIADREQVCVWGDYDVDGLSGTAIMTRFLRMRGARVTPFIPDRSGSGYGFHWPTMERLVQTGVSLFVSVDHGSAATEPIAQAAAAGIDVIVADHHEMAPVLPPALALINPKRPDSQYPFSSLCGAGVAMKLAWAVAQDLSPGARVTDEMRAFLLEALGIAVLGTVADVVPLRGENRVIVRHGLKVLGTRPIPGIRALLDVARARTPLRAADIGFKLGPRINAAGRMGSAALALELLLTDDPTRAREIALQLDAENRRRREVEQRVAQEASARVRAELGERPRNGIALLGDDWHHGVIGIVAARLVDEFHVPAVVIGVQHGRARGSARSVPGFELHKALAACDDHLVAHGGHAGAAGLTIEPDRFPAFRAAFEGYVARTLQDEQRLPKLVIDAQTPLPAVGARLVTQLAALEPFGAANPEPVLAARDVRIAGNPRTMGGRNEHLTFHVEDGGRALRCVAFRAAPRLGPVVRTGARVDLAFTPQRNDFRGRGEVELLVRDVRPATD